MKLIIFAVIAALLIGFLAACKKTKDDPPAQPPTDTVEAEPSTAIKLTQDGTGTWFFEVRLKAPQQYVKTVEIAAKHVVGAPQTYIIMVPKGSTFTKYPLPIQFGAVMSYSVVKWGKWEG